MNIGYGVAGLGVLGLIIGALFYLEDYHRTIGLGGIGVGVILLIVGIWMSMSKPKAAAPMQPATG
jgi:hypothetical protein